MKSSFLKSLVLVFVLFFNNCTSWPGLLPFLMGGGSGGGGAMLLLPPGSDSGSTDGNNSNTGGDNSSTGGTTTNPPTPTVGFALPASSATEGNTTQTITINLSSALTSTFTVDYTVSGTATGGGVDYTLSNGTLTFNAGDTSKDISLVIVDDTITGPVEGNETVIITLSNPSNTSLAVLGANTVHTHTIVDNEVPTVSNVTSDKVNGSYKIGDTIEIKVVFSETVNVVGSPYLTLETGSTDRNATYTSGTGTNTLIFTYTIQAGDTTSDLDYINSNALVLNGGTIKDSTNSNDANIFLPTPAGAGSLGANKALVIDGVVPTVTNVTSSTADGTYKDGAAISIQVTFSENVTVTGTPRLTLETGTTDSVVNYASGSGTNTLTFTYNVTVGDISADLDYVATTSLGLNGGTIADAAGNTATLTLPSPSAAGSLGANKNIVIDTISPTITNVTSSTADGTYNSGSVNVQVTFSEPVYVNTGSGTPYLTLETGTTDRNAVYSSGSGSNVLSFTYTISSGDNTTDLDYVATNSLALNGGTILDVAGNTANVTLASPGSAGSIGANKAIVIDAQLPTVTNISSPTANGTYKVGDVITVQITFSEPVNVTGTPQLTLETGTTDAIVNYVSGSGTNTLTFTYTIGAGHASSDLDYVATSSLALNGGTIADAVGNTATLTLPSPGAVGSLGANSAFVIDGLVPTVTNVTSSTSNGSYKAGDSVSIQVTFSEAVTVTGTPQLTLETGTTDAVVNYASGTGTNTLTFTYTVAAGHTSSDLDYVTTTSLALNSGTIKDSAGNNATLTLATPGAATSLGANKAIVIDTTAPTVTNVTSSTADGSYKAGDSVSIQVTFSESITVTGTPQLTLETGGTDAVVNYSAGTGTNTLTFTYTVAAGHTTSDLDYVATTSLALNSGTINDAAGNAATLTLASPGAATSLGANKAIVIDTTAPTVTNVTSSTADGTYKLGDSVSIQVTFSEVVTVTGTPQLTLETGGTDAVVNYASGTGTNTLTFTYTVATGHTTSDLDYVATTSLALNSGTINDAAGNAATLTLASPAAAGSLGTNKAIVIDGVVPTVTGVTSTKADGTYKAGEVIDIVVNFSESVTVTGTPQITLETGGTDAVVNYFGGSGSNALTFRYTVAAGHTSSDLDYVATTSLTLNSGTIKDSAGNDATLTLASPAAANSLGANKAIVIDTAVPTVTNVTSSTANGSYKAGDSVSIQVVFSESVTVTGTPQLTLETGGTDAVVNYASGTGTNTLTFTYTVAAGHTTSDLDYVATSSLALNSGTINDAAGNTATLTLASPAAAGSLGANKAIVIDTTAPTVTNVTSSTADGSYKSGDSVSIQVVFSESVTVTGTPQLTLETGGTDAVVNYASGTGTNTLTFTYTVVAGHTTSDLDYVATTSLALNGGTINDAAGNPATLTLASPAAAGSLGANKAIVIDTTPPTVSNVTSSKADGTYKAGEVIDILVNFSESVTVTGTPQLTLETGGTDAVVNYFGGSGSNSLTFRYTIAAGHITSDLDYVATTSLALNSGTINDAAGNPATLTLASPAAANSLGANKAIVIDTTPPTVTNVTSSTADGSYKSGDSVSVQVVFSESVTVTGTPQLTLETGGTDAVVNYVSGTGTNTLTFTYTVAAGHTTSDLDYVATSSLALNGGTINDAAGNAATLTLASPGAAGSLGANKAIVIDTTAPTVTNVTSSTANGSYKAGDSISVQVVFSESVTVTGTPQLTLETGGTDAVVNYASGTGTNTLTFTYTVAAGHTTSDLDYVATTSLALNSGTINDAAGNTATLTLASPGAAGSLGANKAIVIDTTAPTVTNVTSSTADGTYKLGNSISIQVVFSESVTVSGTPQLTLETGTSDAIVNYASGSGTNTLTFTYTVGAGHTSSDLDYVATSSLALNGGTINDAAGNSATLTLASPAAAGSLGANKAIVIDATIPTVTNVTSTKADGTYGSGATINVTVTFSESVTVDTTGGTPYITLETGATDRNASYTSGSGSNTLTFTYTVQNNDTSSDLDYISTSALVLNGGTIKDTATNDATLTLPSPGAAGSMGANKAIVINAAVPAVNFSSSTSSNSENTTSVTIPVALSVSTANTVTIDYTITGGTATEGSGNDYTLTGGSTSTTGTLTFTNGSSPQNITLSINNDTIDELDETIIITISNPSSTATLGSTTTHTYTITDDDNPPTVEFASATSSSGDETATNRNIAVNLSTASQKTIQVTVNRTGGSATPGTDFTDPGFPLTLTFNPGETSKNVTIGVLADLELEGNETIAMSLVSPNNATLGTTTAHTFTITDDDVGILSAETMDADNDGQIDHYKITFNEAITDSSFPGYSANAIGSAQTDWLVAGYTGVVLAHGTAAPEADTANDSVIYLRINESGSSDTGAKPDLTTTATPGVTTVSSKTIARVYTASVTEADRAKPVITSATSSTISSTITVIFSEPVYGASGALSCGSGGDVVIGGFSYGNNNAGGATSLSAMGGDTCGTDNQVTVSVNSNFAVGDHNTDTLILTTGIFDAANNTGNITPKPLSITAGPTITNLELYDIDKNGKIDQIKATFSMSIQDSSTGDVGATQFTMGGTALTKVDTVTGGTGTASSPNTDPGTANDSIITLFTDNFTITGTAIQTVGFTQSSGKWLGNSIELQTIADLTSVTVDKAPPVILTAVAAENTNPLAGVDSDDTLTLTFSEPTNKPTINNGNISSIFSLTPGTHSWGTITSAVWNGAGDQLVITFAGTGTTIDIGDYITILGTITDTATTPNTSTNIQSVSPVSGSFSVTQPAVTSASSTTPTTVRVTYSEPVNNTEATTVANYKIATSAAATGICSDNSNFASPSALSISSITKIDDKTYDLTTATQTNGTSYTLIVDKNTISHKDYSAYKVTCPNNANFIGQEKLKIAQVSCKSLTTIVLSFSKDVKTGINAANSVECDSTTECNKRYSIKGTVSGAEIGTINSVKILDGTVCGGEAANNSKVCITHSLNQNGSIYTVVAANNTDGDGFDDTSFGAIQNSSGTENLQASPKDRGSFLGCGTSPQNYVDGPVISDPFGDGTAFGYLNKYNNKIYIGPNKNGNGATRFNADGSFPQNLTFEIPKDTTGSRVSASTASAPFSSIGYSGCTTNNSGTSGCGPDNQDGRGLFVTGTFGGTEYLFLGGAKAAANNDYLYFTQDLDSILNFNYMDANQVFHNYDIGACPANNSSSVTQNQVSESIHIFNGQIYWSAPGDGTNRPFATTISTLKNEIDCSAGDGDYLNMRYMAGVGRRADTAASQTDAATGILKQAQPDILGGIFHSFNSRVYYANSGSISYQKPGCIEGSTYSAGVCEQTGGIVRSTNTSPTKCTRSGGVNTCSDWVDITPTSTEYRKYFSIGLEDNKDLIPGMRPIPAFEEYKSNYYFIRNACTKVLWDDGTATGGDSNNGCGFSSSCGNPPNRNDNLCADADRVPQLWKCTPGADGHCDAGDWSLVAQSGSTGKTNFGDNNNKKITLLSKNGDYLYVGFDNSITGIEIWRTNVSDPNAEGDFSQIGGDGFGNGTNITEIYSNISLQNGSIYYQYLSIGKNSVPVKIYRQQNN